MLFSANSNYYQVRPKFAFLPTFINSFGGKRLVIFDHVYSVFKVKHGDKKVKEYLGTFDKDYLEFFIAELYIETPKNPELKVIK